MQKLHNDLRAQARRFDKLETFYRLEYRDDRARRAARTTQKVLDELAEIEDFEDEENFRASDSHS